MIYALVIMAFVGTPQHPSPYDDSNWVHANKPPIMTYSTEQACWKAARKLSSQAPINVGYTCDAEIEN